MRQKRRLKESRLWAPAAPGEPRLLRPGELDYPAGVLGAPPPAPPPAQVAAPKTGSCQQWERAVLGNLVEQPLRRSGEESAQVAGERYLEHLWGAYADHFTSCPREPPSCRPPPAAPSLLLTDELRADTVAQYAPEPHVIKVRPEALTRHVLAHECCHAWTGPEHGAAFAVGMLYLLEREFHCERQQLLATAHSLGVPLQAWSDALLNAPPDRARD